MAQHRWSFRAYDTNNNITNLLNARKKHHKLHAFN